MGRDEMRAADADRQAVAEQLRAALDEGRLDLHEYDERLQQAYAAKTYGELGELLKDLPSAATPAPRTAAAPAPRVAVGEESLVTASDAELTRRWLFEVWGSWVSVVGITTVIWLISSLGNSDLLYFWPMWVAGPWGVVLTFVTVGGLANGEPRKRAEKQARKQQAKQLKRQRRALEAEALARGELPAADGGLEAAPATPKKQKKTG